MKRLSSALLIVLFLSVSCGKKDNAVEIHFWNFGGTPAFLEWVRERVKLFNDTHPGVRVVISDKSWHMIREIMYANFSAGTAPDIMTLHCNEAAEYGEAGFFFPINTFPDFEEVKQWYHPRLIEATRYKGNHYGLPGSAIVFVLVCNKDLFDAEGIRPPRTWSEFRAAARRLTKDTDGDGKVDQYGLVLLGGDKGGFSYRFAPFLLRAGVRILTDDLKHVAFNTPRGVSALALFADMFQKDRSITPGFLAYSHSEINDLFSGNKVAMSIEGPWFQSMVSGKSPGKQIYTVPVPVPDDLEGEYDTLPTLQDMVMYPINARTEHPAAAWEFVKFLRNEEADMNWVVKDLGGIATTLRALNSLETAKREDWGVYKHELERAIPWPPHPSINNIARNAITPPCEKAVVGELTPAEGLKQAALDAQAILDGKK